MLLGPVFQAELLRTSRRRRYYALRFVYGMLLLFLIAVCYDGSNTNNPVVTIDEAARFASTTFIRFAVVQLITVLLLIPALFGGAIADEKQRKTLHYLMASQLSSFEIVIDKVLGRSAHVAVFMALGLPVVCLLGLVGGVPPEYVVIAYVGTFSTASMAIAMTVLVSTISRQVRQAVLIAYFCLAFWQIVPVVILAAVPSLYPMTYTWLEPINRWVGPTTPLFLYVFAMMRGAVPPGMLTGGRPSFWLGEQLLWMVGLQLATAALLILVAVWRLRPVFRHHESTQPRRKWFEGRKKTRATRPRRWWDRPDCGGDAMAWKERYFARTDIFTKLVILPATIVITVVLVLAVGIDEKIVAALSDLWNWRRGNNEALVEPLRIFSAWYIAIWLLAVAGSSASSVAIEREEDTWISLTSTPLTAWEILRGKVLGALWSQRGFAAFPLGLWVFGIVSGSLQPLGVLGALVALGLVSWMVAAVGVHASLKATTTSKALTSTLVAMVLLTGYPFFLARSLYEYGVWDEYGAWVGLPARIVVAPLMSYPEVSEAWSIGLAHLGHPAAFERLWCLIALGVYGMIAAGLSLQSVVRFDRWLDRPALTMRGIVIRKPVKTLEAVEPLLQS